MQGASPRCRLPAAHVQPARALRGGGDERHSASIGGGGHRAKHSPWPRIMRAAGGSAALQERWQQRVFEEVLQVGGAGMLQYLLKCRLAAKE